MKLLQILLLLAIGAVDLHADSRLTGVLIRLSGNDRIDVVSSSRLRPFQMADDQSALLIWSDGNNEAWRFIASGDTWSPQQVNPRVAAGFLAGSRSLGHGEGSAAGMPPRTAHLDQLLGTTVVRGRSFLTHENSGWLISGKLSIRRNPAEDGSKLPKATAVLLRGNTQLAKIEFEEDQQKVSFEQTGQLAQRIPDGLPTGEYTLKMVGSSESTTFNVEDADWADEVMDVPNKLAAMIGDSNGVLVAQLTVETLLDQRDEDDKPLYYLSDALDAIERLNPADQQKGVIQDLKSRVLKRLSGHDAAKTSDLTPTGIATIDQAREAIAKSQWNHAESLLTAADLPQDQRTQGLAFLYRGVIAAESGFGKTDTATWLFRRAEQLLSSSHEQDRFLVHLNFANFRLNHAQEQLHNHSFRIASGVQQPILSGVRSWMLAKAQFTKAAESAAELPTTQQAAVDVGNARMYALLADIIRTLDQNDNGQRSFVLGERAASRTALQSAANVTTANVTTAKEGIDHMIAGSAAEIQAHLTYRAADDWQQCKHHAETALAEYSAAGSLAGAESLYRLLGLIELQLAPARGEGTHSQSALKNFQTAEMLAEILRDRIPGDQFGIAQAGFFARRAYVNERIIDLLVELGRHEEALACAERAKARSLRDLIAVNNAANAEPDEEEEIRTTADVLAEWPADTAALEYFLGTEKAWLFFVNTHGQVSSHELQPDGGPQMLVAKIRQYLAGTEASAVAMRRRLMSGKSLDNSWQHDLHQFAQTLIPGEVLTELRKAKSVAVVPHHILHYFPFAALVTKTDGRTFSQMEVAEPRYLIDEPFHLTCLPSLLVWDQLKQDRRPDITQVNAIGIVEFPTAPPLPGVRKDIQNIHTAFDDRVQQVLFGPQASETQVRQLLQKPGMLLFATHGHNEADAPLNSMLLLLPDANSDGKLTAGEIFSTPIRSDLIVMSACYSGLADRSPLPGDDLFGIQRSFLQSGAKGVVSGLWDVYDGTGPDLMNSFFLNLANSQPAAAALANSQRAFLNQQREKELNLFAHPYFWAVYTLAGDGSIRFSSSAIAENR